MLANVAPLSYNKRSDSQESDRRITEVRTCVKTTRKDEKLWLFRRSISKNRLLKLKSK
jgi:hypothetical protein